MAVLAGILAALLWGAAAVAAARAARILGAARALAWVYVVGLSVMLPIAAAVGAPRGLASAAGWTVAAAPLAVAAIYLMYAALRRGSVAQVMPIVAMQGLVGAVIAVVLGESVTLLASIGIFPALVGIYGVMRKTAKGRRATSSKAAVLLAVAAAVDAGLALYCGARAGALLGAVWLLTIFRLCGVVGFALPIALCGRLYFPTNAAGLVIFGSLADLGGFASYIYASTHGSVAVAAVLSSQFATVSVLAGIVILGERPSVTQLVGFAAVTVGVALIAVGQA